MRKMVLVLIALLMTLSLLCASAETADPYSDPDLKGYINQLLGYGLRSRGNTGSRLEGLTKKLYDELRSRVEKVAAGEMENTRFDIQLSDLGAEYFSFTPEQLGMELDDPGLAQKAVDTAAAALDAPTAVNYLMEDLPYDMYWYCKSGDGTYGGYEYGLDNLSVDVNDGIVSVEGTYTVSFSVVKAYAKSEYVFDTSLITGVQKAVQNAKDIAEKQKDKGDYEKLTAYRDSIRGLVEYNHEAADDDSTPYGDPWQLIYVFDGDPETKVVCEGYSKAFQYLCDLTSFRGDVSCISVSGTMTGGTGAGRHMWNVVRMPDKKNYLVDVTNWVEEDNDLFFDGYKSGSVKDGYTYKFGTGTISYVYDSKTTSMFTASELEMADKRYDPEGNVLTFTVSYDAAGGTGAPAAQTKTEDVDLLLSAAVPTRSHKLTLSGEGGNQEITKAATFTGWNTAEDGTGTSYAAGGTYTGNADVTLYAQWTYGTAGELPAAEKEGFTFDGWFTAAEGGQQILAATEVTADQTLYPHFTKIPETWTVSYNAAGGTGAPAAQTKTEDVDLLLSTTAPTRSHKLTLVKGEGEENQEITKAATFTGWNTAEDGSGTAYAAGGTYTANAAVTLYAQWTFGTAGELPAMTKEGFDFNGWFTAQEGGTRIEAGTQITADQTLYPHFTEKAAGTFTVSFNAAGGTGAPENQVKTENVDLTLSAAVPTRSFTLTLSGEGNNQKITVSAAFTGWNTAEDGSGTAYAAGGTYTANADVTLYAQWTYGTAGELPAAEKEGFAFDGWFTAQEGGQQVLATTTVSADQTLYPHFTKLPSTFTVSFNAAGGTGAPENQVKTENVDLTLSTAVPTRSHKLTLSSGEGDDQVRTIDAAFTGWNTAEDGSGTAYSAGGTYTENADVTLYAQWTFGTAGELPNLTKEGFDFAGWFTEKEGGEKAEAATEVSSDLTLYARFTEKASVEPKDTVTVRVELTYEYDMTESMLKLINDFRKDPAAWVWSEDDSQKLSVTGLSDYTYDYGLEKIAMMRAAECAVHYAHTRPDGTRCFTLYPKDHGAMAENIAAGYASTEAVFEGWKEENQKYSGQGHRRNMLSNRYNYIGIGCVRVDGVLYWCQAFAAEGTGESKSALSDYAVIPASIAVLTEDGLRNPEPSMESLTVAEGEEAAVPAIEARSGGWGNRRITILDPNWTLDKAIAEVKDGKVKGLAGGKAVLTVSDLTDEPMTVELTVTCKEHTPVADRCKAPTQEETGLTNGSHCDVCGTVLEAQAEIPALKDLKTLHLPAGLKTIEEEAFAGGTFQAVILPEGCEAVEKGAFKECKDLVYVYIPASVKEMAEDAFEAGVLLDQAGAAEETEPKE